MAVVAATVEVAVCTPVQGAGGENASREAGMEKKCCDKNTREDEMKRAADRSTGRSRSNDVHLS